MTVVTPPSLTRFESSSFGLITRGLHFPGAFDTGGQTLSLPGARWGVQVALVPDNATYQAAWRAFLTDLDGPAGRFYFGDPDHMVPAGAVGGVPVVDLADQTGKTLNIRGCSTTVTDWLKAGDYFAYDVTGGYRELKLMTADADTDGAGKTTLAFSPAISRSPADGAAIITTDPTCIMQLVDHDQARWDSDKNKVKKMGFQAIEAVKLG